jgi:2-oxoglutarate ferredoxin oxidoreductase subunit delta
VAKPLRHGSRLPGKTLQACCLLLASSVLTKGHILFSEAIMIKGAVAIEVERCKGCAFCVEFCPTKVLALSSAFNSKGYHPPHVVAPEKCSGCDLCGMYCPDFAIYGFRLSATTQREAAYAG